MPHLHLRTSANLVENVDVPDILAALTEALSRIEAAESNSVSAYHSLHNTWVMGEGAPAGFAHLIVKLSSGRPSALRQEVSDRMFEVMKRSFATSISQGEVWLTVELHEMDKDAYRKLEIGSK